MRIAVVSNYYPEHVGGIETVAATLVAEYRKRGHEVRWLAADVASSPHAGDEPLRAWNLTENRFGFPYPLVGPGGIARLRAAAAWADVMHVHDCLYLASAAAVAAARLAGRPVLLTQHVAPVPYTSGVLRAVQAAAYRTLGRAVLSAADEVVFVNSAVQGHFSGSVRFRRDPLLIPNGVDTDLFRPPGKGERERFRQQLAVRPDQTLVLFTGRFTAKKGLHHLRGLALRRPDWTFLFAGRRDNVDPSAWGLANVRVASPLAREELRAFYVAADVLCIPSVGEGFPVSVQEALCCGTPAVVERDLAASAGNQPGLLGAALEPEALEAPVLASGRSERTAVAAAAIARWSSATASSRYLDELEKLAAPRRDGPAGPVAATLRRSA